MSSNSGKQRLRRRRRAARRAHAPRVVLGTTITRGAAGLAGGGALRTWVRPVPTGRRRRGQWAVLWWTSCNRVQPGFNADWAYYDTEAEAERAGHARFDETETRWIVVNTDPAPRRRHRAEIDDYEIIKARGLLPG